LLAVFIFSCSMARLASMASMAQRNSAAFVGLSWVCAAARPSSSCYLGGSLGITAAYSKIEPLAYLAKNVACPITLWLLPYAGYAHDLIWLGAAEARLADFVRVAGSSGTTEVQQRRRRGLWARATTAVEGPLFLLVCGNIIKSFKRAFALSIEMPELQEGPSARAQCRVRARRIGFLLLGSGFMNNIGKCPIKALGFEITISPIYY
jgi:hypothetical protein